MIGYYLLQETRKGVPDNCFAYFPNKGVIPIDNPDSLTIVDKTPDMRESMLEKCKLVVADWERGQVWDGWVYGEEVDFSKEVSGAINEYFKTWRKFNHLGDKLDIVSSNVSKKLRHFSRLTQL